MFHTLRRALPFMLALSIAGAHAQSQYIKNHGFSLSVGGDGQFTRDLTTNPNSGVTTTVQGSNGLILPVTVNNQRQYTTDSAGFLTSIQFHPVAWAGVEMNYGFTHYQERFAYNLGSTPQTTVLNTGTMQARISTDVHEATAAYQFHPKHIPFQPFVNVGGGALDFTPRNASNQWRGAGLLETGFDLPVKFSHVGFRVEGRSLFYRSPNFYSTTLSTRAWRASVEPSASVFYKF
jgi:hypothetical protein